MRRVIMVQNNLWDRLSSMLQQLTGKCVCICGDFNALRSVEERRSLRVYSNVLDMAPFNRFIEENLLVDLPLCGRKFTWYKGDGSSMSRLDRFLLSEDWCLVWPSCLQVAHLRGLSDHCPLFLTVNEEDWGPRPSRMLKCWNEVSGYKQFMTEKWRSLDVHGWSGFVLQKKLKKLKIALKEWHRIHVSNLLGRIRKLKERVADLDKKGEQTTLSVDELDELRNNTFDIHSLSRMNTSICWQQSRLLWLQDGDGNSKYFHPVMTSQRRSNTITSLIVDGSVVEGVTLIREVDFNYFSDHFMNNSEGRPSVEGFEFRRIDVLEGATLVRPFSIEEAKAEVWDCDSCKSLGPDGTNFGFIKDFWSELSGDIMRFVGDFHRNDKLTKGINSTFIALIPKVESPQKLNDFRPISLVGSLYKILAKLLANKFQKVVGKVVSETQTAFVQGRQIMDGLLIANEAIDEAKKLKKELLLFKVDFEKAYDSIDWKYLDAVMSKMGFPTLWRKWIKECKETLENSHHACIKESFEAC